MCNLVRTFIMSFAMLVITASLLRQLVNGEPSWIFKTNPVIFGKNFQLRCTFANDTENTDQPNKPVDIRLKDGELLNNIKTLDNTNRRSELTMKTYNEFGVSIPYNCQHGTLKYIHTYRMTVENFQYHQYSDHDSHDELFSIEFENVMASPKCSAVYGNLDMTKKLMTTLDQKTPAYNTTVRLPYNASPKCSDSLKVVCQIDKYKIEHSVRTIAKNCSPKAAEQTAKPGNKEKDQALGVVGLVVFSIVAIIYIAGMIGCIYIVRKETVKDRKKTGKYRNKKGTYN